MHILHNKLNNLCMEAIKASLGLTNTKLLFWPRFQYELKLNLMTSKASQRVNIIVVTVKPDYRLLSGQISRIVGGSAESAIFDPANKFIMENRETHKSLMDENFTMETSGT